MPHWVSELRSLIQSWLGVSPERNISALHRLVVSKGQDVSYGTVKNASTGEHEINVSALLAILKVVLPTVEGRRSFVERHMPEYLDFSREILESAENRGQLSSLSWLEAQVAIKLIKRLKLNLEGVKSILGERLYSNLISWLKKWNIGREINGYLELSGPWVDFSDPDFSRQVVCSTVDKIDPTKYDGDLLKVALGMTTRDTARQCWFIQLEAAQKCAELIKQNPGDHEITTANMLKFD
jgi:hypothetical protein